MLRVKARQPFDYAKLTCILRHGCGSSRPSSLMLEFMRTSRVARIWRSETCTTLAAYINYQLEVLTSRCMGRETAPGWVENDVAEVSGDQEVDVHGEDQLGARQQHRHVARRVNWIRDQHLRSTDSAAVFEDQHNRCQPLAQA